MSRNHAKLSFDDCEAYLEDLNSTHGTYISRPGQQYYPIQEPTRLLQGDLITFGKKLENVDPAPDSSGVLLSLCLLRLSRVLMVMAHA